MGSGAIATAEMRVRTGAIQARAFQDADGLRGRVERRLNALEAGVKEALERVPAGA